MPDMPQLDPSFGIHNLCALICTKEAVGMVNAQHNTCMHYNIHKSDQRSGELTDCSGAVSSERFMLFVHIGLYYNMYVQVLGGLPEDSSEAPEIPTVQGHELLGGPQMLQLR